MSRILVSLVRVLRDIPSTLPCPRIPNPYSLIPTLYPLVLLAVLLAACGSNGQSAGSPSISLSDGTVDIVGLPSSTRRTLQALTETQWAEVFKVAVNEDGPGMLGTYSVTGDVVRFSPAFPLDAGRQYSVRFDPSSVIGTFAPPLTATIGRPAEHTEPTTEVTRVYPTAGAVPENVLRMYIEFSAPMGRKSGIEYISLLDHDGKEIPGAVLPLDYEFWSPDHRRFTVFFDPGRVKEGILPNREMGRAFTPGKTVTLVVSADWRDEHGLPLKAEHRRTFEVLPADTRPLNPADWRVAAPAAGGRAPLVVTFPTPLDHSLLSRALGVRQDGQVVEGDTAVAAGETQWSFIPRNPWRAGTYQFLALDILEDVAGNQVGRAFEVDNFDSVDKDPDPKQVILPFQVK